MAKVFLSLFFSVLLVACREIPTVYFDENLHFDAGIYVLNEGNMGTNKATIDFYDMARDTLYRNIYPSVNPKVVMELGDVGNDIAIYGGKMYAVVNCSGKVEVMTTQCRRLTEIRIPNCRSICFEGRYAYVSSYAGPVEVRPDYAQRGIIVKIDTATLREVGRCEVGYQPNGIVVHNGLVYTANSGGYMAPNYDSTVSIVRAEDMREIARVPVAINLTELCLDTAHRCLYISSVGDYISQSAATFRMDLSTRKVDLMPFVATKMSLSGGRLCYYSYNFADAEYGVYDTETGVLSKALIVDEKKNTKPVPYGILADTERDRLYIAFAPSYVNPGYLYVYTGSGQFLSSHRTGDIPGHLCKKQ